MDQALLEKKNVSGNFFLAGLLVSSVLLLPGILDLALLPRFICLSITAVVLLFAFYRRKVHGEVRLDIIMIAYSSYFIFIGVSLFWAKNKAEALFEIGRSFLGLLVFVFTSFFLRTQNETFKQKLVQLSVVVSLLALSVAIFQLASLPNYAREMIYTITGLNAHKNLLSSFLFLMIPFLIQAALTLNEYWKRAAVICLGADALVLLLLRTKAVWLGLGTGLIVFVMLSVYLRWRKIIRVGLNPVVSVLILMLLTNLFFWFVLQPVIQKSIDYTSASSQELKLDQERLVVWDKTCELIEKKPFLGYGAGNWQVYFPDATLTGLWRVEDLNVTFQRPHNDPLWIISETGFIGFNLFLLFFLSLVVFSVKSLARLSNEPGKTQEIKLYLACVAGFATISFFDFPKERIEHLAWINIIFALLYETCTSSGTVTQTFRLRSMKYVNLFSFVFAVFALYIGILRFKGEYFTRELYDQRSLKKLQELIKAGRTAVSFAYSLDPTSVPIHWYVGNANAAMGQYAEAQTNFTIAYKHNPYNRNVLNDLASAYVFNGDIETAKKLYMESARISPRFDDPKLNLAAIFMGEEKFDTATFWLNSLLHDSERRSDYEKRIKMKTQKASQVQNP